MRTKLPDISFRKIKIDKMQDADEDSEYISMPITETVVCLLPNKIIEELFNDERVIHNKKDEV